MCSLQGVENDGYSKGHDITNPCTQDGESTGDIETVSNTDRHIHTIMATLTKRLLTKRLFRDHSILDEVERQ